MKKLFLALLVALVFGVCQPASAETETFDVDAWKVQKTTDDMDDSVSYSAFAIPHSAVWKQISKLPCLTFSTHKSGVTCGMIFPRASFEGGAVWDDKPFFFQYRLDKERPKKSDNWRGVASIVGINSNARQFAEELFSHETLTVRVKEKDGREHTVKFNIKGAEEALKYVLDHVAQ